MRESGGMGGWLGTRQDQPPVQPREGAWMRSSGFSRTPQREYVPRLPSKEICRGGPAGVRGR